MPSRFANLGSMIGAGFGQGLQRGIENSPGQLLSRLASQADAFNKLTPEQKEGIQGFVGLTRQPSIFDIIGPLLSGGGLGGGGRLGGGQGGGQVGGGSPQQPPIPTGAQDIVPLGIYSMPDGSELIPQDQADVDEILKIGGRRKQ